MCQTLMAKAGESWLDEEPSRREFTFGIKRLAEIVISVRGGASQIVYFMAYDKFSVMALIIINSRHHFGWTTNLKHKEFSHSSVESSVLLGV